MNKTGKRADGLLVTNIKNPKNDRGQYLFFEGETRLRKEVERYTSTCEECEDVPGRYDDRGEIVCPECGLVISGGTEDTDYADQIYADKYSGQGGANDSSNGNRGASGHPLMRTPALRGSGPSGNDSAAGTS